MRAELGISASGPTLSCALRVDDDAAIHVARTAQRHAQLAAVVHALSSEHRVPLAAIARIRLDVGPGSYTGLRVAVTFAKVAQRFGSAELATATSVELIALAAWRGGLVPESSPVRCVIDARRERFCVGRLELVSGTVRVAQPPRAVDLDTMLSSIRPGEVAVAEPALHATLSETARSRGAALCEQPGYGAEQLFDPALELRTVTDERQVAPLYLMRSYAEE